MRWFPLSLLSLPPGWDVSTWRKLLPNSSVLELVLFNLLVLLLTVAYAF